MKDVILSLSGPDRTGLVAGLARIASDLQGNWLDSRLMRLGGCFSGMIRMALPDEAATAFEEQVAAFLETEGYHYSLIPTGAPEAAVEGLLADLEVSGQDHPGIVHAIFRTCQQNGVNVEELSSGLETAPWSGTSVFQARARLRLPDARTLEALQGGLEDLAADLLVEIRLQQP